MNEIVVFAMENMWDTIRAHKDITRNVVELILRAMVGSCHPMLVSECLQQGHDVEAEARASIRFLLRAITPRR